MNPTPGAPRVEDHRVAPRQPIAASSSWHGLPPGYSPGDRHGGGALVEDGPIGGPRHEEEDEGDEEERGGDDEDYAAASVDLLRERLPPPGSPTPSAPAPAPSAAARPHLGVGVRRRVDQLRRGGRSESDLAVARRRLHRFWNRLQLSRVYSTVQSRLENSN